MSNPEEHETQEYTVIRKVELYKVFTYHGPRCYDFRDELYTRAGRKDLSGWHEAISPTIKDMIEKSGWKIDEGDFEIEQ